MRTRISDSTLKSVISVISVMNQHHFTNCLNRLKLAARPFGTAARRKFAPTAAMAATHLLAQTCRCTPAGAVGGRECRRFASTDGTGMHSGGRECRRLPQRTVTGSVSRHCRCTLHRTEPPTYGLPEFCEQIVDKTLVGRLARVRVWGKADEYPGKCT